MFGNQQVFAPLCSSLPEPLCAGRSHVHFTGARASLTSPRPNGLLLHASDGIIIEWKLHALIYRDGLASSVPCRVGWVMRSIAQGSVGPALEILGRALPRVVDMLAGQKFDA